MGDDDRVRKNGKKVPFSLLKFTLISKSETLSDPH